MSLYDFENAKPLFPGVHRSFKLSLVTMTGAGRPEEAGAESVPVVLQRGEETIELTFETGQLGIGAGERYREPVFR